MANPDFETWYSRLTAIAVGEFGFREAGISNWNRDGWRPLWSVKCPPRHALMLMRPELESSHA